MDETFEERLAAVERALTDGDHDCSALAEGAAAADRVSTLESRVEELTDRVAELEAATQALRGYVGNVRAVNDEVEQRAEEALAKATAAQQAVAPGDGSQSPRQEDPGVDATTEASPSTDNHTETAHGHAGQVCERCEQPLTETSAGSDHQPSTGSRQSRLEALGADERPETAPVAGGASPGTAAETDGGAPTDEESADLLARVRDLV